MLTPSQVEYELDYWRKSTREQNDARQRKILELWGFTGAPCVLEIGTGPYGGCLPFIDAEVKRAADPLFNEYLNAKLSPVYGGYGRFVSTIEEYYGADLFDAIITMNALDHGDSGFSAVDHIARLLKPGGRFYLHVNLRTEEQLNEGHAHALTFANLQDAIARNGLATIRCEVYAYDPVEYADYNTVVGIWEKPRLS